MPETTPNRAFPIGAVSTARYFVHFAMRKILEEISAHKDVDGFHLSNVGGLVIGESQTSIASSGYDASRGITAAEKWKVPSNTALVALECCHFGTRCRTMHALG